MTNFLLSSHRQRWSGATAAPLHNHSAPASCITFLRLWFCSPGFICSLREERWHSDKKKKKKRTQFKRKGKKKTISEKNWPLMLRRSSYQSACQKAERVFSRGLKRESASYVTIGRHLEMVLEVGSLPGTKLPCTTSLYAHHPSWILGRCGCAVRRHKKKYQSRIWSQHSFFLPFPRFLPALILTSCRAATELLR